MQASRYEPKRAAQVIAFFALQTPNRALNIRKAMKLVYLGDRESVKMWGEPILDETRKSLAHGPVNMKTFGYTGGRVDPPAEWKRYLHIDRQHEIAVKPDVKLDDLDELSRADIQARSAVWKRVGWMHEHKLCNWTHDPANVPEWQKSTGENPEITLADMMTGLGFEDAARRAAELDDRDPLADLLEQIR